jgi:hypothetical protein
MDLISCGMVTKTKEIYYFKFYHTPTKHHSPPNNTADNTIFASLLIFAKRVFQTDTDFGPLQQSSFVPQNFEKAPGIRCGAGVVG